jgi:hypothetical protein
VRPGALPCGVSRGMEGTEPANFRVLLYSEIQ